MQAKSDNDFDYKQDDQIKGVQQMVDLIASDPPIAVVTRLTDSFNKVINCRRKPSEELNRFLSRYRGLAAEHVLGAGETSSSQVGEVLAITLLNNACIPETTPTNAKLQLIRLAEDRTEEEDVDSYSLTEKNATSLLDDSTELKKIYDAIVMYKNEGRKDVVKRFTKIKHLPKKVNESLEPSRFAVIQQRDKRKIDRAATVFSTEGSRCVLQLDDAVSVIRSLAQTTTKQE